jgi:hypothetical protein
MGTRGPRSGSYWVPTIRTPRAYAMVLHEIGHCVGQHCATNSFMSAGEWMERELERERWAWVWAIQNAAIWNADMERFAKRCLRTYEMVHATKICAMCGEPMPPSAGFTVCSSACLEEQQMSGADHPARNAGTTGQAHHQSRRVS